MKTSRPKTIKFRGAVYRLGGRDPEAAAEELAEWVRNESELYHQLINVHRNLTRKMGRGIFDPERAAAAFEPLAIKGAESYSKKFGGSWHENFSAAACRLASKILLDYFLAEVGVAPQHFEQYVFQRDVPKWRERYQQRGGSYSRDLGVPGAVKFRGAVYRLADTWPPAEEDLEANVPKKGQELGATLQLVLLTTSVEAWNRWYGTTGENANLQGADLQGANLRRVNLQEADLQGADLQGADLRGADLLEAHLEGANFLEADLQYANLHRAVLVNANLPGADLRSAYLDEADLEGAVLVNANLPGADLEGANLDWADLTGASLQGAKLRGARYNEETKFPQGFDPKAAGMILR